MSENFVWRLLHNDRDYVSVKKGKHKAFIETIDEMGTYVLYVELVNELVASKKGVSTLSRFVNVNLTIQAQAESIENVTYNEKGMKKQKKLPFFTLVKVIKSILW